MTSKIIDLKKLYQDYIKNENERKILIQKEIQKEVDDHIEEWSNQAALKIKNEIEKDIKNNYLKNEYTSGIWDKAKNEGNCKKFIELSIMKLKEQGFKNFSVFYQYYGGYNDVCIMTVKPLQDE